jgi:hypothetical protein
MVKHIIAGNIQMWFEIIEDKIFVDIAPLSNNLYFDIKISGEIVSYHPFDGSCVRCNSRYTVEKFPLFELSSFKNDIKSSVFFQTPEEIIEKLNQNETGFLRVYTVCTHDFTGLRLSQARRLYKEDLKVG